jgi:hypothetical protein
VGTQVGPQHFDVIIGGGLPGSLTLGFLRKSGVREQYENCSEKQNYSLWSFSTRYPPERMV